MARVKVEDIVDHLSSEFRRALSETVRAALPDAHFDEYQLFRDFKRNVDRKCSTWERVPDHYVECD